MAQIADRRLKNNSPYSAVITREHFLFYEMRTTAKLLSEGYSEEETASKIVEDNLFQYPTEKTVRRMALSCIRRLKAMEDASLITAIANQPSDVAKQVCLYAMMKQYRFESFDMSYSKSDLNVFMMRLQEQDDWVATWSENTITKVKQVLARVLIENEYIDSPTADHLNPVLISPILENAIRASNDTKALIAFNCLA